ncbi:MAG: hypothetical protein JXL84_12595 [Deltaproteobacteria bacterium]|nr:hypothetical protein [Deltaproteobacteria bacterium]
MSKIPKSDSIEELARFWDTHDLTEFEDEMEEVQEPVFDRGPKSVMRIRLRPDEMTTLKRKEEESPFMSKQGFLFIALAAVLLFSSCQGPGAKDRYLLPHVGTWEGVDSTGTKGIVTFREDGTGTMSFQNNTYEFEYVFDYGKKPLWLDLVYSREGRPFRARLIVKYLDDHRLKWFTRFDQTRPAGFPEKDGPNVIILTRLNHLRL